MTWITYALLSALFAGLTSLLSKMGVEGVPTQIAMFIRTSTILAVSAFIVFTRSESDALTVLTPRNWLYLLLSGLATAASWLCYLAALKYGPISGVAPVDKLSFVIAIVLGVLVLGETVNVYTAVGSALILLGVLMTVPSIQELLTR